MTYRAAANEPPALERPPQILGFGFYVLAAGCAVLGIAQLSRVALLSNVVTLARSGPLASASHAAPLVGQVMVLLGLVIAWRAAKKVRRSHGRILVACAALWVTLLIAEQQRASTPTASVVGRALVLGLVALVVHGAGRSFAARTWPTTLGFALVAVDAWSVAWPVATGCPTNGSPMTTMAVGAVGFVFASAGLFAAGRSILHGITLSEYVRAHPKRPEDEDALPALRRGLPLFADAVVSVAGVALARILCARASGTRTAATTGGEIVAIAVLLVAVHRMQPVAARPLLFAYAAVAGVLLEVVAPGVTPAVQLLAAGCIYASSTDLAKRATSFGSFADLGRRLRIASFALAGHAAAAFVAANTADPGARSFLQILAIVLAALAVYTTIAAARDVRRIEVDLAR